MDKNTYLEKMKNSYGLDMKALRKFVKENEDLPDNTPVLCERVTDNYFNSETGWPTYEVEEDVFFQSWCITKDENSILIYNHY